MGLDATASSKHPSQKWNPRGPLAQVSSKLVYYFSIKLSLKCLILIFRIDIIILYFCCARSSKENRPDIKTKQLRKLNFRMVRPCFLGTLYQPDYLKIHSWLSCQISFTLDVFLWLFQNSNWLHSDLLTVIFILKCIT